MLIDTPMYRDAFRELQALAADFGLDSRSFNSLCRDYLRAQGLPETPKNWVQMATEALQDLFAEDCHREISP